MDAWNPLVAEEMTSLTDARAARFATLAPSEGLRQRNAGDTTTRGGERMIAGGRRGGLSRLDPLPAARLRATRPSW